VQSNLLPRYEYNLKDVFSVIHHCLTLFCPNKSISHSSISPLSIMQTPSSTENNTAGNNTSNNTSKQGSAANEQVKGIDPFVRVRPGGTTDEHRWEKPSLNGSFYSLARVSEADTFALHPTDAPSDYKPQIKNYPANSIFELVKPSNYTADGSQVICTHHVALPKQSTLGLQNGHLGMIALPEREIFAACVSKHNPKFDGLTDKTIYGPAPPPGFVRATNH
jgi:hypothetical protein